jgi:protein-tyrosine phosphatase
MEFANLLNFRDAGAVAGKPGVLYRSDALSGLVDETFRIHTVIDLRRPEEIEAYGRAPEWACEVWHNVTLTEAPGSDPQYDEAHGVAGYLVDRYLEMSQYGAADLVRVLAILADAATGPAVVHCAGGRDRTGVVIALILDILGVPDEEIGADYQLTEGFTRRWLEIERAAGREPRLPPFLMITPAEAILTFLARLRERHGSVETYLTASGLAPAAIAALRARFTVG